MRKGFTLIELLAVIVILAIIALITIPAVLKMTDNAKVSSYRRSIDLYGRAINTAIAAYKSDKIEKKEPYQVTFSNVEAYVDYEGNDINCKESKIYSDDTILLTECSVDGNLVYAEKNKGYGSNNYYYYTNATKRIRILEYVNGVNKALKEREFTGNTCEVQSNGNLLCNGEILEVTSNLEKPINGMLTINNNEVISYSQLKFEKQTSQSQEEIPTVIDEGEINTGNNQNNTQTPQETIASETEDYRGYYADVDGDGNVDGVIYADLAFSKAETTWGISNSNYAKYSYNSKDNLNQYVISENKYNDKFGEKQIITLKSNGTGNKRFYVMALKNFTTNSLSNNDYYWYKKGEYLSSVTFGFEGRMIPKITKEEFGEGKENTRLMINKWNAAGTSEGYEGATQDDHDIWKHIQGEYAKGWYIPSRGEWTAFADYLANREENPLTTSNYNSAYGLSYSYWTSSQYDEASASRISFDYRVVISSYVGNVFYVRLGYTF